MVCTTAYGNGLENSTEKDTTAFDGRKIILYDRFNQPVALNDSINYFVVLKSRKYCEDCFNDINTFVKEGKDQMHARYISISLIDSTTLDRKKAFFRNSTLMPDFDEAFFQYINTDTKTLFSQFQTIYSPDLLLIAKGKIRHIPYPQIFQYSSSEINAETKQAIFNLLK